MKEILDHMAPDWDTWVHLQEIKEAKEEAERELRGDYG